MALTDEEREKLARYFDEGFEELALRDIRHANENDVRMGTFILCVTFIDALSLAYSAGMEKKGSNADQWRRFVLRYFDQSYERVAESYAELRNLLVHNYSVKGLAFTSAPENAHLHLRTGSPDALILHRESFVADVERAFAEFRSDVESNDELGARVLRHLDEHPPIGVVEVIQEPDPPTSASFTTTSVVLKLDDDE